jgi:hypothetical protein
MDAKIVVMIAGVVVTLVQVLKAAGVTGRWAIVTAAGLSAFCVCLWGYSTGPFVRAQTWDYFAGWASIFLSACGAFGVINGGAEAVTALKNAPTALIRSLTTAGDGRNPPPPAPQP